MEIYIHTNLINGKRYIGKSVNSVRRWGTTGNNYKHCPLFYRAIQKYGWDNFNHEVRLTGLSKEEANERERYYIALFRTNDPRFGYNLTKGGDGNDLGRDCYGEEAKQRAKARQKVYEELHRDELRQRKRERRRKYREETGYWPNYTEKNKQAALEAGKRYNQRNREKINEKQRERRRKFKEEHGCSYNTWLKRNKQHNGEVTTD